MAAKRDHFAHDVPRVLLVGAGFARSSNGGHAYLLALLASLEEAAMELIVAIPRPMLSQLQALAPGARFIEVSPARGIIRICRDLLLAQWWARRAAVDLMIYPHEYTPFGATPTIIVLQNIGPFHSESAQEFGLRGRLIRGLSAWRAPAAKAVVAASQATFQAWDGGVGVHKSRQFVLPSVCLTPAEDPLAYEQTGIAFSSQAPARSRVLFIVGDSKYKNADCVDEVIGRLISMCGEVPNCLDIRVAGARRRFAHATSLGIVPRDLLMLDLARADLVIFPSRVESLGYPALEAACMGARPAVLAGSAMHQVLGHHCMPLKDTNHSLLDLLLKVISGSSFRLSASEVDEVRASLAPSHAGRAWTGLVRNLAPQV